MCVRAWLFFKSSNTKFVFLKLQSNNVNVFLHFLSNCTEVYVACGDDDDIYVYIYICVYIYNLRKTFQSKSFRTRWVKLRYDLRSVCGGVCARVLFYFFGPVRVCKKYANNTFVWYFDGHFFFLKIFILIFMKIGKEERAKEGEGGKEDKQIVDTGSNIKYVLHEEVDKFRATRVKLYPPFCLRGCARNFFIL